MTKRFLIHYSEIGLKGKNRPFFEKKLISNIKMHLKDLGIGGVLRKRGYIILDPGEADTAEVSDKLTKISGIEYFLETTVVENDLVAIQKRASEMFANKKGSFRVTVQRRDKSFPTKSDEVAREVGAAILQNNQELSVDLHTPDSVCNVEITEEGSFVAEGKIKAVGGLPVGSGGKLLSLISGGIDSPVASAMMLKRGATIHYLHFHNYPYTDKKSIEIVKELIAKLNANGHHATLSMINLTPIQEEVVASCDEKLRVILYRRFMFRLAEIIAEREGAGGIVTGESMGQVASQTVENMRTVEAVTTMPIFRPLIGMDKDEIVLLAKKFGTYELSIKPHSDCCSLFIPKHPATKTTIRYTETNEAKLDVEKLIADALKEEQTVEIRKNS